MMKMFDRSLQQIHNTIQDLSDVVKVQRVHAHKLEMVDLKPLQRMCNSACRTC